MHFFGWNMDSAIAYVVLGIFVVFGIWYFCWNLDSPIALVEAQPGQVLADNDCIGHKIEDADEWNYLG